VDRTVAADVAPGDVAGMAMAIATMLERLKASPAETESKARAEAERLFAPELVCQSISAALERLVDGAGNGRVDTRSAHAPGGSRLADAAPTPAPWPR
jgi:hypothetical protein